MPEPKIQKRKITDYRPDPANPNAHSERGVGVLGDSIASVGLGRSIVVDRNGIVLAGNSTQERAVDQGFEDAIEVESDGTKLIVVRRNDLDLLNDDDNRARKLSYYDNRAAELGIAWDSERLLADINAGVDLSHLFTAGELDELLADLQTDTPADDPGADMDRASELQAKWQVERGQLWIIGDHRLLCGDSTNAEDVARVMGGERADAVVTDPPYGQNQAGVTNDEPEKLKEIVCQAVKNLPCDNAIISAFQSPRTFTEWLDATRNNGIRFERMLWMYKAAQMTFPWRGWLLKSEAILISSVGNGHWQDVHPYSHDCYYMSELSNELPKDSGWHGSVKPLHVVSDIMLRISEADSTVYDPFLGSGTTLVACEQTGRKGRGIEISEKYCAVILERLSGLGLEPRLSE